MADGVTMSDVYAEYRVKLAKLVAERDRLNAAVQPLQDELVELNRVAEASRLAAEAKALEISEVRGGQSYINLKKEIAALSSMLSGK